MSDGEGAMEQQRGEIESDFEWEFLGESSVNELNYRQKVLYNEFWGDFLTFLREEGKNPARCIGFEESSVRPISRRVHQIFECIWEDGPIVLQITPEHADQILKQLDEAEITTESGDEYDEESKRKFKNALEAVFRFLDEEWVPEISFSNKESSDNSDPFTKRERGLLFDEALDYKSPPTYSNVSPEERDRWNRHIAQYLGIPKDEISPSDWEELRRSWKVASIIATSLDAGWRVKMVQRLETTHLDLENEQIIIPAEDAVKNDKKWTVQLSTRSVKMLKRWLPQRSNQTKYDGSRALWLNREGNRYKGSNLNNLLQNLMEEAGIEANGRKLTWHSIRHSTGMYLYNQHKDLKLVAEVLRQKSLEAATRYAHPTPETKKDAVEAIQGGVY